MGMTGYYFHPDCKLHKMGDHHPECPERLDVIEDRLLITGVADALERREPQPASDHRLAANEHHLTLLQTTSKLLKTQSVTIT